jgi:hypothetical protein
VRQGKPGETEGQRPSKEEREGKTGCETTHKSRCRGDGDRGKRQNEKYRWGDTKLKKTGGQKECETEETEGNDSGGLVSH